MECFKENVLSSMQIILTYMPMIGFEPAVIYVCMYQIKIFPLPVRLTVIRNEENGIYHLAFPNQHNPY